MVLIVGSKNASPKLLELVPQKFQDLTKFLKEDEINAMLQWIHKQPHLPRLTGNPKSKALSERDLKGASLKKKTLKNAKDEDYSLLMTPKKKLVGKLINFSSLTTESQLMVFLNAANYSVERAKDVIDNYYTLRTRAPELFGNRNPEKVLSRAFKIAYFVSLPETVKTYSGNQIIILKLKDTDPANADFVEGVKTTFALVDITVGKYPLNKGMEIIMDMEGLALGHLTRVDFSALRVFMTFCQEALPTQLKAVHVINTFSLINQVMAIVKPLLNIEFLKKIHFYTPNEFNKFTSEYVPLECLPRELGGSLDSIEVYQEEMFRQFKLATEWFEELEKYKVDESKRLGRRRSDLNVCDGSFRKLELD